MILSKLIGKKKKEFKRFIKPAIDKGFDDGSFDQKAYRNRMAWVYEIERFLETAIAEAVKEMAKEVRLEKDEWDNYTYNNARFDLDQKIDLFIKGIK